MYHYVRPDTSRPPGGYYRLDSSDFRNQLDAVESVYDVLDRERFTAVVRGEEAPPEDGLVLTFDDGLVDHCEWVLPELRERGLSGVFFVSTGPLDGVTLPVHRVHALLGSYPAERVAAELRTVLDEQGVSAEDSPSADTYGSSETGHSAAASASTVKRLLNFELPPETVPAVLHALEARLGAAPPNAADYYLSADDVRTLDDAGMLVGAHTVTHPVLSRLPEPTQRAEIGESFDRLEDVLGTLDVRLFAYPYGGPDTFTDETRAILADVGCDAAFTTVSGTFDATDLRTTPFTLDRQDCNEFPHGDASFSV